MNNVVFLRARQGCGHTLPQSDDVVSMVRAQAPDAGLLASNVGSEHPSKAAEIIAAVVCFLLMGGIWVVCLAGWVS